MFRPSAYRRAPQQVMHGLADGVHCFGAVLLDVVSGLRASRHVKLASAPGLPWFAAGRRSTAEGEQQPVHESPSVVNLSTEIVPRCPWERWSPAGSLFVSFFPSLAFCRIFA
jgi:hypothetical protein